MQESAQIVLGDFDDSILVDIDIQFNVFVGGTLLFDINYCADDLVGANRIFDRTENGISGFVENFKSLFGLADLDKACCG